MLRVYLICLFVTFSYSKSLDRNYDRDYEKGILKKDTNWQNANRYNVILRTSQETPNSEGVLNIDVSEDMPSDFGDTRRSNVLRWMKHLIFSIPEAKYDKSFEDMSRIKKDDVNVTAVLIKLTEVLDGLNRNIKINNENGYISLRVPVDNRRASGENKRVRRDIENIETEFREDTSKEDTSVLNIDKSNEIDNNQNSTVIRAGDIPVTNNSTENSSVENSTVINEVKENEALLRELPIFAKDTSIESSTESSKESSKDPEISGRRMANQQVQQLRIKEKLLEYLEEMFENIENKIQPLTNVKLAISSNNSYRIGYIIASIDTLEVSLRKLKSDMRLNKVYWDDSKIMELFDKLKVANSVVSTLIETLKSYLPRPYVP